ncbi:cytotoxic and regulatory T-cell molecule [Prinia subflava]|uniref:cytotoxic and regulatory T-cell molecule n=1 Tax=Prinia subflava TaxID=208062 RepID=UPI002FDF139E
MSVPGVLLAVLLLQGGFPGAASDSVTLKEGENLNLHCTFSTPSSSNSTLQWLNPQGFTIFLNARRVLRDQRYKLLHHSRNELSIQLSNVSVQDEGIYSCFYYSSPFQSKSQNVRILAAPSHPVLEVSRGSGRGVELSCHTQGCRPQPQISWLLDNGVELPGDTRHRLGADGKKWSTSSTLRILSYSPKVTASCVLQHPALGGERLMASLPFQDLPSTGCKQPSRISEDAGVPSPSENPAVPSSSGNPAGASSSTSPEDPEVSSSSTSPKGPEVSTPSAFPEGPGVSTPSASQKNSEVSTTSASPENPDVSSPSASPKDAELSSPSASPGAPEVSSPSTSSGGAAVPSSAPAQPNPTAVTPRGPEETTTAAELGGSSTFGGFNGTGDDTSSPSGDGTEEERGRTEVPAPRENRTAISTLTFEQNPESKAMAKKERNLLLPILVAALIFVLLLIVLLFLAKLKKAHGVWKRENDVSEQTLESYKSRSNEESPGHEKNGQAVNPKSNLQYVTERQLETPGKNPETPGKNPETSTKNPETPEKNPETPEKNPGDKNMEKNEKMLECGRETDV